MRGAAEHSIHSHSVHGTDAICFANNTDANGATQAVHGRAHCEVLPHTKKAAADQTAAPAAAETAAAAAADSFLVLLLARIQPVVVDVYRFTQLVDAGCERLAARHARHHACAASAQAQKALLAQP